MPRRTEVPIDRQGRVVVPAELRRELGISPGEKLLAWAEPGRIMFLTREALVESVRELFSDVDPERSLVDELLAVRRAEAALEDAQATGEGVEDAREALAERQAPAPARRPPLSDTLTARERRILELVARGKTTSEIARGLEVSPETVQAHLESVLRKMGAPEQAPQAKKRKRAKRVAARRKSLGSKKRRTPSKSRGR